MADSTVIEWLIDQLLLLLVGAFAGYWVVLFVVRLLDHFDD